MKKNVYLLIASFVLFFLSFLYNVNADECSSESLNSIIESSTYWGEEITSKLYSNLNFINRKTINVDSGSLQGFAISDNYIAFAHWFDNASNTNVRVLDKTNYEEKDVSFSYIFGHANDFGFNSKTKEILISNTSSSPFGITTLKIDDLSITLGSTIELSDTNPSGITYDKDHDQYIIYNSRDKKIHIKDLNFNDVKSFDIVPTNLTTHGIAYWNNHIYFSCFEKGRRGTYQSVYNYYETSSNLIYVYNLDGNLEKVLYIPISKLGFDEGIKDSNGNYTKNVSTWVEIESVDFYNDGTMLLGFNVLSNFYNNSCNGTVNEGDNREIRFYTTDSLKRDDLSIKDIYISSLPTKTEYYLDDKSIDLTGGIISIKYGDGFIQNIPMNSEISIPELDTSKIGSQTITFDYLGYKLSFTIEIKEKKSITESIKDFIVNVPDTLKNNSLVLIIISLVLIGIGTIIVIRRFKNINKI